MDEHKKSIKKDVGLILVTSMVSAILYIALEGQIMAYGRDTSHPLLLRFLPVFCIQFGMSCLGVVITLIKNKESLTEHGLMKKNFWTSIVGCFIVSLPTILFLAFTNDIQGFLPFQGMFLTKDILNAPIPANIIGYIVVALTWGLGEGLFYVVLADKINMLRKPSKFWNLGAFVCAIIAIAIHGMIGVEPRILLEALVTFILMYGSLIIREKTNNAWGNILIFFAVWNAF